LVTAQGGEDLVRESVGIERGLGEVRVEVAAVEGGVSHGHIPRVGSGREVQQCG
jgi:hypothetical protein